MDLTLDGHVHTAWCNHAQGEMEDYVEAALARGLRTIVFSEHVEAGIRYRHRTWLRPVDIEAYFATGFRLKRRYAGRIEIVLGCEVGYNPQAVDALLAILDRYPWEHRGLSYHFYEDRGVHLNLVSRKEENLHALAALGPERVLDHYFATLAQGLTQIPCEVLCHMDAALRHLPNLRHTDRHRRAMTHILDLLAERGIALEVNTSGYAIRQAPFPAAPIVTEAKRRGIRLIAGSDAHRPDQVAREFHRLRRLA